MKNAINHICKIHIKAIVTLVVIAVFAVLALRESITPSETLIIVTTIIGFYFGTATQKVEDENESVREQLHELTEQNEDTMCE